MKSTILTSIAVAEMTERGREIMGANSNPGHAGRPGQRGGSAKRTIDWHKVAKNKSQEADRASEATKNTGLTKKQLLDAHDKAAELHSDAGSRMYTFNKALARYHETKFGQHADKADLIEAELKAPK